MSATIPIVCAAAALALLSVLPARSAEPEHGEWRRVGPSFACKVDSPKPLPPSELNPDKLMMACMHMGPFAIGDEARTLVFTLGAPHRSLPQPEGAKALLWFLGARDHYPYLIATVLNDRVVALQVTGVAPARDFAFNHVNLGDGTATLTGQFGAAYRISKSDQPDTDLWAYAPWPFSFEVKGGHVTSIRIVDPARWK